jgi:tRNA(Ile2) C34 agmatinyltransferase TiaS
MGPGDGDAIAATQGHGSELGQRDSGDRRQEKCHQETNGERRHDRMRDLEEGVFFAPRASRRKWLLRLGHQKKK